jgi:hypothetical protein
VQPAGRLGRLGVLRFEGSGDGGQFRVVEAPHQLADELALPAQGAEVRQPPHLDDGVAQLVGQRQGVEQVGAQRLERLAEFLQVLARVLALGAALRFGPLDLRPELAVGFAAGRHEVALDVVAPARAARHRAGSAAARPVRLRP